MKQIKDKFSWVETAHGFCPVFSLIPEANCPVVVFCHGYTGCNHSPNRLLWRLSRALYEKGIGSIRFDYNGFGNSSGSSADFNLQSAIDDTIAILQYTAGIPDIDADRIGIFGYSLGGRIAAYILGNAPEVKAGILCNAAGSFWKNYDEISEIIHSYEGDTAWDNGWEISKSFFSVGDFGDGANDIQLTDAHILIINGTDDEIIPVSTGEYYQEKLYNKGKRALLEEIIGGDHFFTDPASSAELIEKTIEFYTKKL